MAEPTLGTVPVDEPETRTLEIGTAPWKTRRIEAEDGPPALDRDRVHRSLVQ